jgi:micrococcal nuclease
MFILLILDQINIHLYNKSIVVSVYDGDATKVNITNYHVLIGEASSVIVRGVGAPEIRVKCSSEKAKNIQTRNYLRSLLASAEVIELHNVQRGKYFRIVANAIIDGINISELMIEKQIAREYDGKLKRLSWCK